MAMTYTMESFGVEGNKRIVTGTFTMGAGDSSGALDTGLRNVDFAMAATETNAAASPKVERNTDTSGDKYGWVKITVGNAGDDGYWMAIGY